MKGNYYVYIMSSISQVLYIGMTNNLTRRVAQHKSGLIPGFSAKYHTKQLVYFEDFHEVTDALRREKELKGWSRAKKITLIQGFNPHWIDYGVEREDSVPSTSVIPNAVRNL